MKKYNLILIMFDNGGVDDENYRNTLNVLQNEYTIEANKYLYEIHQLRTNLSEKTSELERIEKIINNINKLQNDLKELDERIKSHYNNTGEENFEKNMIPRNWVYCDGKYYKKYQYLKEDEENIGLENIDDINNKNEYIKTPNLIEKTIFGLNGVDDKNNYNNSFGANSRNIQKFLEIPEHRHKLFMHNKEHVKYSYIEYLFQPGGIFLQYSIRYNFI